MRSKLFYLMKNGQIHNTLGCQSRIIVFVVIINMLLLHADFPVLLKTLLPELLTPESALS